MEERLISVRPLQVDDNQPLATRRLCQLQPTVSRCKQPLALPCKYNINCQITYAALRMQRTIPALRNNEDRKFQRARPASLRDEEGVLDEARGGISQLQTHVLVSLLARIGLLRPALGRAGSHGRELLNAAHARHEVGLGRQAARSHRSRAPHLVDLNNKVILILIKPAW